MSECTGVQVVVRVRPLNSGEKALNTLPIVNSSSQRNEVTLIKGAGFKAMRHTFYFDRVFNEFTTQQEVFDQTLAPMVSDLFKGFESTVFAYGQTGTGKTYTMEGEIDIPTEAGVIPRSCEAIFQKLVDSRFSESSVRVSYLEIYNEELCDLLVDTSKATPLKICEDVQGKVLCWGLSEVVVTSTVEVLEIIRSAQARRRVGETKMNKVSSRSHCLFSLSVTSKEHVDGGVIERRGKLHLVDLAGSECAKATGADANSTRLRESQNINKSLLTLGRVITSLKDKTAARVPYRDSKLTRLLQEALGGHSKTCVIATLSPSVLCADETLSTLKYADKARGIENKASQAFVRMQTGIDMGLPEGEGGSDARTFSEMEQRMHYMEAQCEEAQAALGRKHEEVTAMQERAEQAEERLEGVVLNLAAAETQLREAREANVTMTSALQAEQLVLAQHKHFLRARTETEEKLTQEATQLLSCLDTAVHDCSELYSELRQRVTMQDQVKVATQHMSRDTTQTLTEFFSEIKSFSSACLQRQQSFGALVESAQVQLTATLTALDQTSDDLLTDVKAQCLHANKQIHTDSTNLTDSVRASSEKVSGQMTEAVRQVTHTVSAALTELATLRGLHQRAAKDLVVWSDQTQQRVSTTTDALENSIQTHQTCLKQQSQLFSQNCSDAASQLRNQESAFRDLLAKVKEHIGVQNEIVQIVKSTQRVLEDNKEQQLALLEHQHQTLQQALRIQKEVGKPVEHAHHATLEQAYAAITASARAQVSMMANQLSSLSEAVQQHETNGIPAPETHLNSLAQLKTRALQNIASQLDLLNTQAQNLQALLSNKQLFGDTETKHLNSLQSTTQSLSSCVSNQLSLLATENAHLHSIVSNNLETQAYSHHQQHLKSLSLCSQNFVTSQERQRGLIVHQRQSLVQTASNVRTGAQASQTQHFSTIAKTEQEFKEHNTAQIAMLDAQRLALENAVTAQEQGQQQLIEGVLEEVRQLLTSRVHNLGALFSNNMEKLRAKNSALRDTTSELDRSFVGNSEALQAETATWAHHEHKIAEEIDSIVSENDGVGAAIADMGENFEADTQTLTAETRQWNECDREIAQELAAVLAENISVQNEVETSFAAFQGHSSQLVEETQAWRRLNQAVIQRVEAAQACNSSSVMSEQKFRLEVVEDTTKLENETNQWASSNSAVYSAVLTVIEANKELQAAAKSADEKHSALLQSAISETEAWGTHCDTTTTTLNKSVEANTQAQELILGSSSALATTFTTTQHQLDQQLSFCSETITASIDAIVGRNEEQLVHLQKMEGTENTEYNLNAATVKDLSTQVMLFSSQERQGLATLLASRDSVNSASEQHISGVCSQVTTVADTLQSANQVLSNDLMETQHNVQVQAEKMDRTLATLHDSVVDHVTEKRATIKTSTKDQVSGFDQMVSLHRSGVAEASKLLARHSELCSASATSLSQRLGNFCNQEVRVDSPATPVKAPSEIAYSRALSKTTSEDVLLASMNESAQSCKQNVDAVEPSPRAKSLVDECGVDENENPKSNVSPVVQDPKKKRRAFSDISNAPVEEQHVVVDKLLIQKRPKASTLPRASQIKQPTVKRG